MELSQTLNAKIANEYKLLYQVPFSNFLYQFEDDYQPNTAEKQRAYIWLIEFVYRLRNALFLEIIDPLDNEWQILFKKCIPGIKTNY